MNKRDNNLDLLRIVAAIMVIVQHVLAIYIHRLDNNLDGYYETANIYFSMSVYAVPIFVMLSGAFLLSDSQNSNCVYFYRKMRNKIIKPTILWSILYVLFVELKNYIAFHSGVEVDFYQPIKNLLNGRPYYHLWYLFMIIGLYAVTPILIMIKDEISQKNFYILGIVLLVLGVIIDFTSDLYWVLWFTEYLGYFILGYTLKQKYAEVNINRHILGQVGIIIICSISMYTLSIFLKNQHVENSLLFYGNLSIFNIVGSISIFIMFLKIHNINIRFYFISKYTFTIYLVHHGIIDILGIIQEKITLEKFNPIWYVPIMTMVTLILSFIFSIISYKIKNFKSRVIISRGEEI